ncbi:MAG TPA: PilZ domain-containing protein [Deltaproteobacteria bacterium]|nr:PilZ domain-containing protein [Deltaproteobacteria bacterium]
MAIRTAGSPSDMFAVLLSGDDRWLGRLLPPSGDGPPWLLFPWSPGLAALPLGSPLALAAVSRATDEPAQGRGRLSAVSVQGSKLAIELQLEDRSLWAEVMPDVQLPTSDRRSWPRHPKTHTDTRVPVYIDAGPRSARRLVGRLVDTSPGGLGLRFPMQAEPRLCQAELLLCSMILDGSLVSRRCMVRHRRLLPVGVRYGLAFLGTGTGAGADVRYEAQWTCSSCGADPLLADSHLHCPSCGRPRGSTPTRLPDWDELLTEGAHRFTGSARTCLRCGAAWAGLARNCGHCGTRLPRQGLGP